MLQGGVAQAVEQGTHKPCVTGSSPVAATIAPDQLVKRVEGFFMLVASRQFAAQNLHVPV